MTPESPVCGCGAETVPAVAQNQEGAFAALLCASCGKPSRHYCFATLDEALDASELMARGIFKLSWRAA